MNNQTKFVQINDKFMQNIKYFSPQVANVWISLKSYWWNDTTDAFGGKNKEYVYPSLTSICNGTGLSKPTVRKCMMELKILGFIKKIEKRVNPDTKTNDSNRYYLNDEPKGIVENLPKLKEYQDSQRRTGKRRGFKNPFEDSFEDI